VRALSLLLWLSAVSAWGAEPPLTRAEQAFDALEFDAAAEAFQEALAAPGSREERLRAWEGLALARAFMGQPQAAQEAFEVLLVLDPAARVQASLGPKIRAPFEAAREALQGQRPVLTVTRAADGRVVATLEQPRPVAVEVLVAVRTPGAAGFTAAVGPPSRPVSVKAAPERAVEAYALARDAGGAILFEQGSMRAPLRLDAREPPPPAVAAARDAVRPAVEQASGSPGRRPLWPFVVGGVGLAAAGVVLGVVLSQPEPLALPPADRTERLP
jgi:tetratricopeptide (TPR) repeat protein